MSTPNDVDLEELIIDWALTKFRKTASKDEVKLLERDLIATEVDWKQVHFERVDHEYKPPPVKPGEGDPIETPVYHASYDNRTGTGQTYHFKADRSTRSLAVVKRNRQVNFGVNVDLDLPIPAAIMKANLGFKLDINLTDSSETTFEEQVSWGMDSQIAVKPKHHLEVKLIVREEEYNGAFYMTTHLSGRVRVIFRNLQENNSFIMARGGQIFQVVDDLMHAGRLRGDALLADGTTRRVVVKEEGKVHFRYGVKQVVEVKETPLDAGPARGETAQETPLDQSG